MFPGATDLLASGSLAQHLLQIHTDAATSICRAARQAHPRDADLLGVGWARPCLSEALGDATAGPQATWLRCPEAQW